MKTTNTNLTIEERQALIEENKKQLAIQEAMLANEEKILKSIQDAEYQLAKEVKQYERKEAAYRKYFAELKKESVAVQLTEKEVTLSYVPKPYLMTESGDYETVPQEDAKVSAKVKELTIQYRGYHISVTEHITEGEGWSRGKNRGFEMQYSKGSHIPYNAKWYRVANTIITRINEEIEAAKRKEEEKELEENLKYRAAKDLKAQFPDATVTTEKSGTRYGRDSWVTFYVVTVKFENGNYATYRIYKGSKDSGKPYQLYLQESKDAKMEELKKDPTAFLSYLQS